MQRNLKLKKLSIKIKLFSKKFTNINNKFNNMSPKLKILQFQKINICNLKVRMNNLWPKSIN